uniref:Reverse transcriptase domain-containing protein n=1 Tax=Tanacetum cinerariifolium TaxID=118510 RepID=A0A6L2NVM5_TANCI|nr:reverse transcriptase domain-containing protein [Tanacetum cinerariifolium]
MKGFQRTLPQASGSPLGKPIPRLQCAKYDRERKEPVSQDRGRPASDAAFRKYCDRNYNQLLPIIAESSTKRRKKNEKLKGVKARLNFGGSSGTSRYSESRTMSTRKHEKRHRSRRSRSPIPSPSVVSRIRCERSRSPKQKLREKEGGAFKMLGDRGESVSGRADSHNKPSYSRYTEAFSESEDNEGGHWKSRSKKKKPSSEEDDLMPSHNKTCDGSEDLEDHLKKFQAAAKTERWAMLTWCHMFNYTLTGNARVWFDDLPAESIDNYDDLKKAFLENYLQQKKYIKDPIELHNIKQRDGESTKDFVRRYKLESRDVKRAPEEVAASNHERKKSFPPWKQQEGNQKQNFRKGSFRNQQRPKRKQDRFTLLTKTPKDILALEKGKFKAPPPMTTPVEKRNHTKFCEFHEILFPTLDNDEETEGPMIIEAEIEGHCIHRMYVNGRSASKILYEHCFSRLRSEIKNQLVPATTPLIGFNAWMNFVVVRSPSSYNGIIGRPGIRKLQAILSTAHEILKLPVEGGVITLKRSRGQAADRNQAIQKEVGKLMEAGIMKEVHYHDWLSNPVMIGRNLEVYVDDLVIKSHTEDEIVRDIEETFKTLREINMKLNPKKCTFWVEEGIFLGPRVSVKAQILANFIVERTEDESSDTLMEVEEELPKPWILFTDGSSCTNSSRVRLVLTNPEGMEFTYALRFRFDATNNEAEYEALIAGLRIAKQMGVKNLQANVDSHLVANQVNGTYVAKEADMIRYLEKVRALTSSFKAFSIRQVPRIENKKANALSKIASTNFAHLSKKVMVKELKEKSISEVKILAVVKEEGDTWMTPIFEYLKDETLPPYVKKPRALRRKSQWFAVINETLYKKSFLRPWLRCVGPLQANYVLREIHKGSCSMHAGTRSVVSKALRIGYYWPTMHKDARVLIKACQDCQVHKPIPRNPQQTLTPITSPWPFCKWGIDIAGPFPKGPRKVKFLIVAVDYFTKWIEGKPVATITGNQIKKFVKSKAQLRRRNKSKAGYKKQELDRRAPSLEIGMPTLRTAEVYLVQNNEAMGINLDLLEERREEAAIREAKSKARMEKYYNSKVKNTSFKPGDLVYRNNDASRTEDTGNLGPTWEGTYEVTEALGKGAYKLKDRDGKQLSRTWNVSNLKKCYIHKM